MAIIDNRLDEVHRNAYNAAFHELGLNWFWDAGRYLHPACPGEERACVRSYLEDHQAHLLTAYDAEFLVDAIQAAKARCLEQLTAEGCNPAAYINWREIQQRQTGA